MVFEEDEDFQRYRAWLCEYAGRYSVKIWAYCLMRNHVHFVCVPKAERALAHSFNMLHMRYAQYYHGKKGVTGHLWRGRFLSCMLDDRSVFEEVRYIENNPVRAGLVERAEDYPWSSARSHVTGEPDAVLVVGGDMVRALNMMASVPMCRAILDWRSYLAASADEEIVKRTHERLKTGRPSGDLEFVRKLEEILRRRLEPLPRGRPRKDVKR